jgi:hypothetical protein
MSYQSAFGQLSALSAASLGVFRGCDAVAVGVDRKQLGRLVAAGAVVRELPDTYRVVAAPRSSLQRLTAALLWAGDDAMASGRSAGELYELEGVPSGKPEIAVPSARGYRHPDVIVGRYDDRAALMPRRVRGIRVTGIEATLLALGGLLDHEAFEIACEDARRRRLTSVAALRAYADRFGGSGRPGTAALRRLLRELDPIHAARSTLEVKTRRLLVANGLTDFVREFPLAWNGCTWRFDFAFPQRRTILETNGRRWHDDPRDYEADNERWSVPGRHGFRLVLATWSKVTERPHDLVHELTATMVA